MFFFGPESEKQLSEQREPVPRPSSSHRAPSPETTLIVPRKRTSENGPNSVSEGTPQPTIKRSRKAAKDPAIERNGPIRKPSATAVPPPPSTGMDVDAVNGHPPPVQGTRSPSVDPVPNPNFNEEHAGMNGVRTDDQMDVDSDDDQLGEPSPEMPSPIIPTLTTGDSIGIQVAPAKIADLGPSTTVLNMPGASQLNQACWRPQDQNVIVASGESICSVWRTQQDTPSHQDLIAIPRGDAKTITSVAWEPNGKALAVATWSEHGGELHLYDSQEFGLLETLPAAQRAIVKMRWHASGFRLVGLAPFDDQSGASNIVLWDLSGATTTAGPMSVGVPETLEDVDCAVTESSGFAFAAGGEAVYECRAYGELEVEQKYSSLPRGSDKWTFVKCSWRHPDDKLLIAASSETGRIWLPDRDVKKDAHKAGITGLQIRPHLLNGRPALSTSEFATSSEDGTIKVWLYNHITGSLETTSKLMLGAAQLLKSLSYSPDGFCLAGASYGIVKIWNAEHAYHQMASWEGKEEVWRGNSLKDDDLVSNGAMSSINGEGSTGIDHSLSWDSDSKRLAFALGSQVRVLTRSTLLVADVDRLH